MKRVLLIVVGLMFGVMTVAQAEDSATSTDGTKSTNAATKAQPNGAGGATPAMPGNETAKKHVTENRKKMEANRERARERHAERRAEHRAEHGQKPERPAKPEKPEKPSKPERGGR